MKIQESVIEEIKSVLAEEAPERLARLRRIAEIIRTAGGYHWLGIYEVSQGDIVALAWAPDEAPPPARFPATQGLCGAVVKSGETVVLGDVSKEPRYLATFSNTRSEIVVPIRRAPLEPILALIDVQSEGEDAFTGEDRTLLEQCASILAVAWFDRSTSIVPAP